MLYDLHDRPSLSCIHDSNCTELCCWYFQRGIAFSELDAFVAAPAIRPEARALVFSGFILLHDALGEWSSLMCVALGLDR